MKRISRRTFLGGGLAAGAAALAGYSALIETDNIRIQRVAISLPRLPEAMDGLTIGLISDLHFYPYTGKREINHAISIVNHLQPDLVCMTGDFVTEGHYGDKRANARYIEPCSELLTHIRAPLGCYAVLGNHEYDTHPEFVAQTLRGHGIPVLQNQKMEVQKNGSRIWIAGLDDALHERSDIAATLKGIPSGETVVLMAHEPDTADESARYPVDLQLSGHSHGGQVCIPGAGPPLLPPLGRKYPEGLYKVGRMALYTNRGIGVSGVPFRFDCPPEVTLLELRRGGNA
jgi:predicted MPP superfamily phosphohydrolase